jgi:hypothetical protein
VLTNPKTEEALPPLNVTPIVLPAFTACEAHLLFPIDVRGLPNPVVFEVRAKDRNRKMHAISISIPNVVKNTLSG